MYESALKIQYLDLKFEDQILFQDFNLRLGLGEKITLSGPSGGGKSTLLRCILGFVAPDGGTIEVLGENLTPASAWGLRDRMAYVPQEPELAAENVRVSIEKVFSYRKNSHLQANLERMTELLERLLLPQSILDKQTTDLSGGEKQRVALLVALLLEREILLLDEVTSALDINAKEAVMQVLAKLDSVAMLGISHDHEWLKFADHVVNIPDARGVGA